MPTATEGLSLGENRLGQVEGVGNHLAGSVLDDPWEEV